MFILFLCTVICYCISKIVYLYIYIFILLVILIFLHARCYFADKLMSVVYVFVGCVSRMWRNVCRRKALHALRLLYTLRTFSS